MILNLMRLSGCYQLLDISEHSFKAFTNEASVNHINIQLILHMVRERRYGKSCLQMK